LIHLWTVPLTGSAKAIAACRDLLSSEEKARADRFVFARDHDSYTLSQGALRLLLASYLTIPAHEIRLAAGPKGKPSLLDEPHLDFNKSHSKGLALYAFTDACAVGVDVEEVRQLPDFQQIASRFFCPGEAQELASVNDTAAAFFRCWTRKEAYIKAVGDGLSIPLDEFQVTLLAEHPVRFVHIGNDERAAFTWNLHHLEPAVGYIGALAYSGARRSLQVHDVVTCEDLLAKSFSAGSV
jgi:4'-phosphopantetheinyl transferase